MAFSRLSYDNCSYKSEILQSVGSLNYILSPEKFVNPNPTRIAFGIVSGNDVSIVKGNMVDVESDLMGVGRTASKCPSLKFLNECSGKNFGSCQPKQIVIRGNQSNSGRVVDTTPLHLRESQMFRVTPVFLPPAYTQPRC